VQSAQPEPISNQQKWGGSHLGKMRQFWVESESGVFLFCVTLILSFLPGNSGETKSGLFSFYQKTYRLSTKKLKRQNFYQKNSFLKTIF
jgi:hypothetical protein